MQLQFRIPGSDKRVACRAHVDCPMLKQEPPTVDTCWDHVSLPGIFSLDKDLNSSDPGRREKARRKTTKEYYEAMGVPGYQLFPD
jgi:hypothetical protein